MAKDNRSRFNLWFQPGDAAARNGSGHHRALAAAAGIASALAAVAAPASAHDPEPVASAPIVLPTAPDLGPGFERVPPYFGRTFGGLTAQWWQWAMSIPAGVNPLADESGEHCDVNQEGRVWFLAGTTGGAVTRACTIPPGKAVLFPIFNVVCTTATEDGETKEELRRVCTDIVDAVTELEAAVDGEVVVGSRAEGAAHRVQSPPFSLVFTADNVFGVESPDPNPSPAVAEGFWVLLAPLSLGEHVIEFRAVADFTDLGGDLFTTEVEYRIAVEQAGGAG